MSCAEAQPNDVCEAELRLPGQQAQRGPIKRQQWSALLSDCALQNGSTATAEPAGSDDPDRNGFRIGDEMRATIDGGWYQAKIIQRNGDSYRVRLNASTGACANQSSL